MNFIKRSKDEPWFTAFYFKEPKLNNRKVLVVSLIILLFSIANPLFLILLLGYIGYCVYKYKVYSSEENKLLCKAIEAYKKEQGDVSLESAEKVLDINQGNNKALIIAGLNHYNKGNYRGFVELIKKVPKDLIKIDLDLQLKLGESYENLGEEEEAKRVYKILQDIFPESKYLREKLK